MVPLKSSVLRLVLSILGEVESKRMIEDRALTQKVTVENGY